MGEMIPMWPCWVDNSVIEHHLTGDIIIIIIILNWVEYKPVLKKDPTEV